MPRFEDFTDAELDAMWRAIVFDDGVMYLPTPDSLDFALVAEIEREWVRRGNPLDVTLTGASSS